MTRESKAFRAMQYAYGAVLVLAGLDKLFATNFIVFWPQYISSTVESMLTGAGVSVGVFLALMGLVELVVGIAFFTRYAYAAAYLSVVWLVLIAINLIMMGLYDIAIRDLLLAVGAYATGQLALLEVKAPVPQWILRTT
jgi:hypothetical protein